MSDDFYRRLNEDQEKERIERIFNDRPERKKEKEMNWFESERLARWSKDQRDQRETGIGG